MFFCLQKNELSYTTYYFGFRRQESSHWDLFCKKGVLRCVFAWEIKMLCIVQPQLGKRAILLKLISIVDSADTLVEEGQK